MEVPIANNKPEKHMDIDSSKLIFTLKHYITRIICIHTFLYLSPMQVSGASRMQSDQHVYQRKTGPHQGSNVTGNLRALTAQMSHLHK